MTRTRRLALHALAVLAMPLLLYAAICAWMYHAQRDLLYFPQATRVDAAATDFALARGGIVLRGWVANPGKPRALLYFGGNAESVQRNCEDFARWFPGHTVYLLAYRGYGASDGTPTQALLVGDAVALYDHVHAAHPRIPIDAIGRSLGSGVASQLAARRPVDRLALVTPFDGMADIAQAHYPWLPVRWLLQDGYRSAQALAGFDGSVLIVRAGRDAVIPAARTQALVEALPRPPQVLDLPDAGHDDVQQYPTYGATLSAFLEPATDTSAR